MGVITITEALAEIKTIGKRVQKKREWMAADRNAPTSYAQRMDEPHIFERARVVTHLDDEHEAMAKTIADARWNAAQERALRDLHTHPRSSSYEIHVYGARCEVAAWLFTGGNIVNKGTGPDDGCDLDTDRGRVDVKGRTRRGYDLYVIDSRRSTDHVRAIDRLLLVYPVTNHPHKFELVGWLTSGEFLALAEPKRYVENGPTNLAVSSHVLRGMDQW